MIYKLQYFIVQGIAGFQPENLKQKLLQTIDDQQIEDNSMRLNLKDYMNTPRFRTYPEVQIIV